MTEPGSHPQTPKLESGPEDPGLIYQAARRFFSRADNRGMEIPERFLSLGGHQIRLRFADSRLIPYVLPALAHLAAPHMTPPDLEVFILDAKTLPITRPIPPRQKNSAAIPGIIWGYTNQRRYSAYNFDSDICSLLDIPDRAAVCWIMNAERIPPYERGAPLRPILHWWLRRQEQQLVHGAAVGYPDGGVLLAGRGGSGKSTAALACLSSPLMYAGDDYALLRLKPEPRIDCLYSSAKLETGQIVKFPQLNRLKNRCEARREDKILVFLYPDFREKIVPGFPLRAVLIPRITGKLNTDIRKATPAAGLKALAPSTVFQLPGGGQQDFLNMAGLLKQVPCFFLELGTDLAQIPEIISDFLKGKKYGI